MYSNTVYCGIERRSQPIGSVPVSGTPPASVTCTVSPALPSSSSAPTSRLIVCALVEPAAVTVGSNSNFTTSPPFVFMSAVTVPATWVRMSAVENWRATASAALPSAYRLDSASASDSVSPSARILTVRPPWTTAVSATVTVDVSLAHDTAIEAAIPPDFLPGTLPCSSREVSVVIAAVALASEVMLTAPPPSISTPFSITIIAVASACE